MIGYKIGTNDGMRVLVTLEISKDAKTNLDRTDIKDKEYAKYRCDRCKVLSIEDTDGNRYQSAKNSFYDKKIIEYKVGEDVIESNFNKDINIV